MTSEENDSMNSMQFSTFDHDRDAVSSTNCAIEKEGAGWYNSCFIHGDNFNSKYMSSDVIKYLISYENFSGYQGHSLQSCKMMFK